MKIAYQKWNPKEDSLNQVRIAEDIIREYQGQGYTLTLRQLYYQFVARDLIPNTERSYKNLGNTITKGRMAGMISWEAIEDRNRHHNSFWVQEDPMVPIRQLPQYIRFDRWARQDTYVEVWVEKEALGNVVARACNQYMVPHLSCKGYLSASEAWRAGRRFEEKTDEGKRCVLIHLGDHDPSGIDMTRDNQDRMDIFTEPGDVEVRRIALNMDQVAEHSPPPNPAKVTDSRAKGYIKKYGPTSWELDALEPAMLEKLIIDEIENHVDQNQWDETGDEEEEVENQLSNIYNRWDEIRPIVED